jgi:hypothetical protein
MKAERFYFFARNSLLYTFDCLLNLKVIIEFYIKIIITWVVAGAGNSSLRACDLVDQ